MSSHPNDSNIDAEHPHEYLPKDALEAEEDHLAPSHWWVYTTLFPLTAATFGPLATAFNICAISSDLALIVDPSSKETEGTAVPNAAWATALVAVALALGALGNLTLVAHNFGDLRFSISQPITIAGWYIASFLLIGLVAAAPAHLNVPAGEPRTFSQAYYYACFSAAIFFFMATLMVITGWSVWVQRMSIEFKLTLAQRTLGVQVCCFLGYLLIAAAVYMKIEGWLYLDAVYWTTVTLFTIGFGDFSPKTHLGRGLLFPMAVGGILFVGLIVTSVSTVILGSGARKISRRNVEKARQRLIRKRGHIVGKNAANDLDRGEEEFNLIRAAQHDARLINIALALIVSAGSWLFLWIIGGVIFWQAELSTQGWSYFEALYFVYVSFTTIGYGDFYPQDNSAKPAFVLWAMLALPTLTVLIGAIGGAISEGVGTLTLWIAEEIPELTPGMRKMKAAAFKAKKGEGGSHRSAKPPGFMEEDREDGELHRVGSETTTLAVHGLSGDLHPDSGKNKSDSLQGQSDSDKDKADHGKHYRGYLLMKELKNVSDQVDASPPRKYSYAEWVWFLQLLGEDEKKWNWHGQQSPLIISVDEPKWVMQKLMAKLQQELKEQGHERTGRSD